MQSTLHLCSEFTVIFYMIRIKTPLDFWFLTKPYKCRFPPQTSTLKSLPDSDAVRIPSYQPPSPFPPDWYCRFRASYFSSCLPRVSSIFPKRFAVGHGAVSHPRLEPTPPRINLHASGLRLCGWIVFVFLGEKIRAVFMLWDENMTQHRIGGWFLLKS